LSKAHWAKKNNFMKNHRHLIHRDDVDQINEFLSQRAANDAGSSVGLSFIAFFLIAGAIGLGVFTKFGPAHPKLVFGMLILGGLLAFLSGKVSSTHFNDPTNLR